MGYLLTEIVVYLVIAGLIGFAFGWAVKAGSLDKYFTKFIELVKKVWTGIKGLFKKSDKPKEDTNETTKDGEKFCLLTKVKEIWSAYYLTLTTSKKVVKEEKVTEAPKEEVKAKESKEEVASEKVAEVIKEEMKTEAAKEEEVLKEEPVQEKEPEVETPVSETPVETSSESGAPKLFTQAPVEGKDKLSSLKGIGPVLEKKLNELGVYTFEQIASWDTEQELWIGTQMAFPKRVAKEEWVKQAKELLNAK